MQIFMPTSFMVLLSWISFLIPPNSFPGRMGLLGSLVLCIINVMINEMEQSPTAKGMSTLDIWCVICPIMVAIASIEYAFLLYFLCFGKFKNILFSQVKVSPLKITEKSRTYSKTRNNFESSCMMPMHAKFIDRFALIIVPALFIFIEVVYFVYCLIKGDNAAQNGMFT